MFFNQLEEFVIRQYQNILIINGKYCIAPIIFHHCMILHKNSFAKTFRFCVFCLEDL